MVPARRPTEVARDDGRLRMNGGCVLQVADYSAAFFSNFLSSLLHLRRSAETELGLDSVFVFPEAARTRPWLRPMADSGAQVEFLDRNGSHRDRTRTLRVIARRHDVRLYHSHFGTFDVDVAYAAVLSRAPVVWHMHSPFPEGGTPRQRLGERLKFALLPRMLVDRVVAVSPSVAESAVRHGAPAARLSVVLNGIDTDRAHPLDLPARRALRVRRGIPERDIVFILLGWSPRRKGVDLLVEAIGSMRHSADGRVRGVVVRGEANEDELRRLVGAVENIEVIPPIPDVADLYGLADCFVSASRAEGLPYAIGEAMAAGLPVVSSDLPQVVEAYGPAGAGLRTFRSGDALDLRRALSEVAEMPDALRRELGEANRAFVTARLSVDQWTREILALYRSLLRPRR